MSEYKTLDSWFPDGKPDGRKFEVEKSSFIVEPKFKDAYETWYCLNQNGLCCSYTHAARFKEYQPPKQTKKVKMYKPIHAGCNRYWASRDAWNTDKSQFATLRIVGWATMEVEIEE